MSAVIFRPMPAPVPAMPCTGDAMAADVVAVAQRQAQRQGERGLSRADRTADADAQRAARRRVYGRGGSRSG